MMTRPIYSKVARSGKRADVTLVGAGQLRAVVKYGTVEIYGLDGATRHAAGEQLLADARELAHDALDRAEVST